MAGTEPQRTPALTGQPDDAPAIVPAKPLLDALIATRGDGVTRRVVLGDLRRTRHRALRVSRRRRRGDRAARRRTRERERSRCDVSRARWPARPTRPRCSRFSATRAPSNAAEAARRCSRRWPTKASSWRRSARSASRAAGASRSPVRLAREVLRTRDVVVVDDFSGSARPLLRVVPDVRVGPMLLAPLIAHERHPRRPRGDARHRGAGRSRSATRTDCASSPTTRRSRCGRPSCSSRRRRRPREESFPRDGVARAADAAHRARRLRGAARRSGHRAAVRQPARRARAHAFGDAALASVIEEVLAFSSLDEGREVVRPTDFLAADLVRAVGRRRRAAGATEAPRRSPSSVPDEPIRMTSDVDKVRQILVNLAGNAVKFTDVGEVRLELERAQRRSQVHRARHGHRHRQARPRAPVQALRAARHRPDTTPRRHGTRPLHLPGARRAPRRPHRGRVERSGEGSMFTPRPTDRRLRRPVPATRGPEPAEARLDFTSCRAFPLTGVFNDGYIAELYESYRRDPASVDESWRQFFRVAEQLAGAPSRAGGGRSTRRFSAKPPAPPRCSARSRRFGHLAVPLDPLGTPPPGAAELKPEFHGITESDLDDVAGVRARRPDARNRRGRRSAHARPLLRRARRTSSST